MTVEVGPGMQIGDGFDVVIDVTTVAGPAELAFTGAGSAELAVIGATAIAGGVGLVAWSRRRR